MQRDFDCRLGMTPSREREEAKPKSQGDLRDCSCDSSNSPRQFNVHEFNT
jgi:hypothetical protein